MKPFVKKLSMLEMELLRFPIGQYTPEATKFDADTFLPAWAKGMRNKVRKYYRVGMPWRSEYKEQWAINLGNYIGVGTRAMKIKKQLLFGRNINNRCRSKKSTR
jgi:hypothetical protein